MDNIKTGKLIAECRREKGLTQQQLADLLNLSNRTISKWESGMGSPDISNLPELAKVLEITVDELLNGEKNPKVKEVVDNNGSNHPARKQLTDTQKIERAMIMLGAAIGAILGIVAYNQGWLG